MNSLFNGLALALQGVGVRMIDRLWRLGSGMRLFMLIIVSSGESFRRLHLTIREIYFTGVLSMQIILVSGFFVGMVLALQMFYVLRQFGSPDYTGVVLALSIIRELGPVVTALLFAGRAGTAITAEIGLMKANEELSAMEMMAVSPIARVVAPRFWAGVISMPILSVMFAMVGIIGGYLVAVPMLGVDEGAFWSQMQAQVDFRFDILNSVIKSLVFGVACTMIALFEGFDAPPTAEGVSHATTRTVVTSSLAILGLDFILTSLMLTV